MVTIEAASSEADYNCIAQLANTIWREHYIPIIGKPQIDYMLEKFQSAKAIKTQVQEGFEYFLLYYEDAQVGYLGLKKDRDSLFLSKIYVLSNYRGKKIGKGALQFAEEKAKSYNLKAVTLTVNKNNLNTISAYEKLGFNNLGSIVIDIGSGYVMDDYKMVKTL